MNTNCNSVNNKQPNTEDAAETITEMNPVPDPDLDIYGNIRASGVITSQSTQRETATDNSVKGK